MCCPSVYVGPMLGQSGMIGLYKKNFVFGMIKCGNDSDLSSSTLVIQVESLDWKAFDWVASV